MRRRRSTEIEGNLPLSFIRTPKTSMTVESGRLNALVFARLSVSIQDAKQFPLSEAPQRRAPARFQYAREIATSWSFSSQTHQSQSSRRGRGALIHVFHDESVR